MRSVTYLIVAIGLVLGTGSAWSEQKVGATTDGLAVKQATDLRIQAVMLARSGDFITADEMFSHSIELALSVDDPRIRDWTLLFIATAQARAGSVYAGIETANSIETSAYQHWALGTIAPIQAASGDLTGALETVDTIPVGYTRARAYGGIAVQQAHLGDSMQAGMIADIISAPDVKFHAYVAITRAMAGPQQ
ncbi:MAG TPA: hypothetical protein EYQ81_08220 [Sneathiellales bacterium]|jgi:hypothetical protein|nr:hypothetical protein [Sneathiellales bacterium]